MSHITLKKNWQRTVPKRTKDDKWDKWDEKKELRVKQTAASHSKALRDDVMSKIEMQPKGERTRARQCERGRWTVTINLVEAISGKGNEEKQWRKMKDEDTLAEQKERDGTVDGDTKEKTRYWGLARKNGEGKTTIMQMHENEKNDGDNGLQSKRQPVTERHCNLVWLQQVRAPKTRLGTNAVVVV